MPGFIFVLRLLVGVLDTFSAFFADKGPDICDCDSPVGLLWVVGEEEFV